MANAVHLNLRCAYYDRVRLFDFAPQGAASDRRWHSQRAWNLGREGWRGAFVRGRRPRRYDPSDPIRAFDIRPQLGAIHDVLDRGAGAIRGVCVFLVGLLSRISQLHFAFLLRQALQLLAFFYTGKQHCLRRKCAGLMPVTQGLFIERWRLSRCTLTSNVNAHDVRAYPCVLYTSQETKASP